ncbi:MAG: site-specific integrase [Terriglobales bacterium]
MARRRYQRGALRLEGKNWILRWREDAVGDDGTIRRPEKRATVGTIGEYPTKRLARRAADRIIEPLNAPDYKPGKVATVQEFAAVYMGDGLSAHKPMSAKATRQHLKRYIIPMLGAVRLDEISGPVVQRLVNAEIRNKLSRKTIMNVLGTLRAMLKRAQTWNYQVKVFAYGAVSLPPEGVREPARSYTPDESLQLIENAPSLKWKTCFALTAVLGLRCGEVLGLTWDAIDTQSRVLAVRQSVVEGQIQTVKSKNSRRDLHLPEYLIDLLNAYRSAEWRVNKWNLLFTNHRNKPYHANRVREFVFNPLRDRLGLGEGALHAFRHGAATAQLQAGASIVTVKENLGHAKIETTMLYTHAISTDQREAVDKMAALFESRRADTAEFCGVLRRNERLSA